MERGWYFRFFLVLGLVAAAVLSVWPSVDTWIPAPQWAKTYFTKRISAGLDIQGGLRLVYEVEVEEAVRDRRDRIMERMLPEIGARLGLLGDKDAEDATREDLARVRDEVRPQAEGDRKIRLSFADGAHEKKVDRDWLREQFPDLRESTREGSSLVLSLREESLTALREGAVRQAVKTIRNRIDEMAIREMTVIGRGTDIIIEIPGGDDLSRVVNALTEAGKAQKVAATTTGAGATGDDATGGLPAFSGSFSLELSRDRIAKMAGVDKLAAEAALVELEGRGVIRRAEDLIEIPDADSLRAQETFARVRSIVSRTARLEFKVLDDESDLVANLQGLPEGIERLVEASTAGEGRQVNVSYLVAQGEGSRQRLQAFVDQADVPPGHDLLIGPANQAVEEGSGLEPVERWRTYTLFSATEVTGEDVSDAYVGNDENGRPVVQIDFNNAGAKAFADMTGENVKRRMAIVLDDRVESAPVINERIGGGKCQVSLGFGDYQQLLSEASDLVVVLKAGALPAPIRPSNEQLIGATLGKDAVSKGAQGGLIGVGLVLLFMLLYYHVAGFVADIMVVLNLVFLLAILTFFEATLTLPGIAGIALTVGMAVDANVLITERIREELRLNKSPRAAVDQGFKRAFWSIFDSQITTFIAGVVLFQYGTGPIKGFAVTLMIGILTSLFTGVFCSKVLLDWITRGLRVQKLRVG